MDNRCSYIAPTDYSPEKKLENLAFGIIDLIAAQENLNKLVESNPLQSETRLSSLPCLSSKECDFANGLTQSLSQIVKVGFSLSNRL